MGGCISMTDGGNEKTKNRPIKKNEVKIDQESINAVDLLNALPRSTQNK